MKGDGTLKEIWQLFEKEPDFYRYEDGSTFITDFRTEFAKKHGGMLDAKKLREAAILVAERDPAKQNRLVFVQVR